jgi:hypothetical protein
MHMGPVCFFCHALAIRFTDEFFMWYTSALVSIFSGAKLTTLVQVKKRVVLIANVTASRTTIAIWRRNGRGLRITTTLTISATRNVLGDILIMHRSYGVIGITTRQKTSLHRSYFTLTGFWDYTLNGFVLPQVRCLGGQMQSNAGNNAAILLVFWLHPRVPCPAPGLLLVKNVARRSLLSFSQFPGQ